jgi:hypothetical protein
MMHISVSNGVQYVKTTFCEAIQELLIVNMNNIQRCATILKRTDIYWYYYMQQKL